MKKYIYQFIHFSFLVIFLFVNFVILFNHVKINVTLSFLFNNNILILFGGLILIILIFLLQKMKIKLSDKDLLIILSLILFVFELFVTTNALFRSGWDVGMIYDAAYSNVFDKYPKISFDASKSYFEAYPNNILLLLYEMFFAFITRSISKGPKTLSFILVFNNCLIFTIVGVMVYLCTKKIVNNRKMAFLSWIIYAILIGTSSWFLVPYSDSIGLLFPMLILFVYLYFNKKIYFKIFLLSLISFIGYQIKPQILIIFISIIGFEFLDFFDKKLSKDSLVKLGKKLVIVILTYLLVTMPISYIKNVVMELDSNKKIGLTHFLMMGLNEETNGVWSGSDVSFSTSFPNRELRTKNNLEECKKRLNNLKFSGTVKHLRNKILVNFNDGTFFFGEEGSFYVSYYWNEFRMNRFVTDFAYSTGKYYIYVSSIRHAVWLFILLLLLFCYSKKNNREISVIQLSLIGLFLFEILFEARSRYLFIYVPYFIILAILAINKIMLKLGMEE